MNEIDNEQGDRQAEDHGHDEDHGSHASFGFYVGVAVALGVVTFYEWAMLALPGWDLGVLTKPVLIILSVAKFAAVVAFFMHLKFDAPIFQRLFVGVLSLALIIVFVVMAVLGSLPEDNPEVGRLHAGIRPCSTHADCGPTQRCRQVDAPKGTDEVRKKKGLGERTWFGKCLETPKEVRDAEGEDRPARSGDKVYAVVCVACHQADGSGKNAGGTVMGADLSSAEVWAQGEETLINSIKNGKNGAIGAMPAQAGLLSDEEITNVLAHIKATFAPK